MAWIQSPLVWVLLVCAAHLSSQDMVTLAPNESETDTPLEPTPPIPEKPQVKPTIRALHITSDIKYRYATTLISSRVVNPSENASEAAFVVTLPESAFISEFLMEVKGKVYKAYVKEKEEAKAVYDQAVQAGQFAGHVALDARDSNQFTVSINVEAHGKVTFNLTYEQLLSRNLGLYSNVININPQQIVKDMSVTVNIEEPTAITTLEVPELQTSNEALPDQTKKNEIAKIEELSPSRKQVVWAPTAEQQRSQNQSGVSGQFIVKYDVDREANPQQILVDEGYFVHFFAPENLPKLKKHVVFVLDYSGSMAGRKLEQLKDAMNTILSDLNPTDYFSVVIFQSFVEAWSPSKTFSTALEHLSKWELERMQKPPTNITLNKDFVVEASPENINSARSYLASYTDLGATNIIGGLRTGLELVKIGSDQWINESDPPQPVMVFLTDGQPNVEEYNTDAIINKTKPLNTKECPIFGLAFGYGADFNFLRKLSLSNFGFARNIYEAADASNQLKNFYQTIASPLLSNVTFSYLPGQVDNSSKTKQDFPVFFKGSEIVVAGKVNKGSVKDKAIIGELTGVTADGFRSYPIVIDVILKPKNSSSGTGHLEKAWAYLTIQQLLDKADSLDMGTEKNQTKEKALQLALQYSFVTPLTSLVVIKPNETESAVDTTQVKPGSNEGPYALPGLGGSSGVAQLSALSGAFPAYPMSSSFALNNPPSPKGVLRKSSLSSKRIMNRWQVNNRLFHRQPDSHTLYDVRPSLGGGMGFASNYQPPPPHPPSFHESEEATPLITGGMPDSYMPGPPIQQEPLPPVYKVNLNEVKWLQQYLSNSSDAGNITVSVQGQEYNLALNETDQSFGHCQSNSTSGECHHIKYCALNVFTDNVSEFIPYQCTITGEYVCATCKFPTTFRFLGVCCPGNIS